MEFDSLNLPAFGIVNGSGNIGAGISFSRENTRQLK
jgi:hypothetical protein